MKIIGKVAGKPVRFVEMANGTVFDYGGFASIKVEGGRAVSLASGDIFTPNSDWIVETVYPDAVLYLHGAPNE